MQDFEFIVASDEARSPGERLLAALRRCRGTYIAIHPGNGHFRPDALAFAAAELGKAGEAGGLCCAGFLLDEDGPVAAPADIVSIILFGYRLGLASGFLKRQALVDCGLDADDWPVDSLGLEIWTRIAVDFGIRSVDRLVLDCARPQDDVIAPPEDLEKAIDSRMSVLARHFSRAGFFQGAHMALLMESQLNQLSSLRGQLPALGFGRSEPVLTAALQKVVAGLRTLLASDHRVLRILDRQSLERAHALGLLAAPVRWFLRETGRMKGRFPIHAGYTFWNFPLLGQWCTRKMFVEASPQARLGSEAAHATKFADVYAVVALLYEARGQIEQALLMCSRAAPSHDITIDNLASQAQLKLAGTSEVDLAEAQRRRMKPHVRECKSPFVRTARAPGERSGWATIVPS